MNLPPALSKPPRRVLRTVEEHGDILPVWVQSRFVDKEIVIFDRHLDYKFTPANRIAKARKWMANPDSPPPIRDLPFRDDDSYGWGIDDFIWVAAELGLIKSLIWVMPAEAGSTPDGYGRVLLQQLERIPYIGMEVIGSFAVKETFAEVRTTNLRIRATSIRHLARVATDPDVHFEFDLDYFVSGSGQVSHTVPEIIGGAPRLTDADVGVTLCFSETSGFLPVRFRSLAEGLAVGLDCEIDTGLPLRKRFPASEDLLKGMPLSEAIHERLFAHEIPSMGACGHSWAAEQHLALGDIGSAVASIQRARAGGDRATIACYKLAIWFMKRADYRKADIFLGMACEAMTDTVSVHALKLRLICRHRLGSGALDKDIVRFAVTALSHILGILELVASLWNGGGSEERLSQLIAANIELRKCLC